MTTIKTETWDHLYNYKIFTSFHTCFAAITVTYRLDRKKYGEDMPVDIIYGSGGTKEPVGIDEYVRFAKEMSDAWKVASTIVKHHKKSTCLYNKDI
jgi:hypothetical protein